MNYNCPECSRRMLWLTENETIEGEEYSWFTCENCMIELYKYLNRGNTK